MHSDDPFFQETLAETMSKIMKNARDVEKQIRADERRKVLDELRIFLEIQESLLTSTSENNHNDK